MLKEKERLFTCSSEYCDFHINKGEENYIPLYTDKIGGLWCPCCHSKMIKEEE